MGAQHECPRMQEFVAAVYFQHHPACFRTVVAHQMANMFLGDGNARMKTATFNGMQAQSSRKHIDALGRTLRQGGLSKALSLSVDWAQTTAVFSFHCGETM
ncbi:hypothetical protein PMIN03_008240 [Paraphaeosphaeria minitans]